MQTKHTTNSLLAVACGAMALALCGISALGQTNNPATPEPPKIKWEVVPTIDPGPTDTAPLKGHVIGLDPKSYKDYRIVLYAKGGDTFYVQPREDDMMTDIEKDGAFSADVHGGTEFVALLVKKSYKPKAQITRLPQEGDDIIVIDRKKVAK